MGPGVRKVHAAPSEDDTKWFLLVDIIEIFGQCSSAKPVAILSFAACALLLFAPIAMLLLATIGSYSQCLIVVVDVDDCREDPCSSLLMFTP